MFRGLTNNSLRLGRRLRRLHVHRLLEILPRTILVGHKLRRVIFRDDFLRPTLDDLRFGALRIGLVDLATGVVRPLAAEGTALPWPADAKQINPQWAPDGTAVYFVGDRDGVSNVFRFDVTAGGLARVTDVESGVTGITPASPALAVASDAGAIAYSVYEARPGGAMVPAFTLENYARFLGDPFHLAILWKTVAMGLWVTAWCLLLGYPLAYTLARLRSRRLRALLVACLLVPLMTSVVVPSPLRSR